MAGSWDALAFLWLVATRIREIRELVGKYLQGLVFFFSSVLLYMYKKDMRKEIVNVPRRLGFMVLERDV